MRPWRNPGEVGPDAGEGVLEEVHWAAANLLGGTGWLVLQQSGVAAVAQRGGTAELSWCGG